MLDEALAFLHDIDPGKRTAFQARLKNFIRLGLPDGLERGQGKATQFRAGQVVQMALAMELTQLGLTPDRIVRVMKWNAFPIMMATRMAARGLLEWETQGGSNADDHPPPMYIYCDPAALHQLTVPNMFEEYEDGDDASTSFFYGGPGVIRDNIVRWTTINTHRLSFINVTSVLLLLTVRQYGGWWRNSFFAEVVSWCDEREEAALGGEVQKFVRGYIRALPPEQATLERGQMFEELVPHVMGAMSVNEHVARRAMERVIKRDEDADDVRS